MPEFTTRIRIHRSTEWVEKQRLESGENVPDQIVVDTDPADLTMVARTALLEIGRGSYPENAESLGYNADYSVAAGDNNYGRVLFLTNVVLPTPKDVDDAILAAIAEIATRKTRDEKRRADRETDKATTRIEFLEKEQRRLIIDRNKLAEKLLRLAKQIRKMVKKA